MDKNSGTRSGLLWQVERILEECKELGAMPKILLMENVPDLVGVKHINNFKKWRLKLEQLGYSNYDALLNAKDFGIPQNRKRCFMVSILGNYNYKIPATIPLDIRLKNVLEDEVDEKFYLSEKQLNQIICWKSYQNPLDKVLGKESISPTITTRVAESQDGGISASMILLSQDLNETTNVRNIINIKNATKKGYLEAEVGDGIDISGRMQYHRGTVQKGISQTITTAGGENVGVVVEDKSLWTETQMKMITKLRIRKLTPKECLKLMGLS